MKDATHESTDRPPRRRRIVIDPAAPKPTAGVVKKPRAISDPASKRGKVRVQAMKTRTEGWIGQIQAMGTSLEAVDVAPLQQHVPGLCDELRDAVEELRKACCGVLTRMSETAR